jgi:hypothetical protein
MCFYRGGFSSDEGLEGCVYIYMYIRGVFCLMRDFGGVYIVLSSEWRQAGRHRNCGVQLG